MEGWNDAGEAATRAIKAFQDEQTFTEIFAVEPDVYFDYQYNRPHISHNDNGTRTVKWPKATLFGAEPNQSTPQHTDDMFTIASFARSRIFLLSGKEPSRNWRSFSSEMIDVALTHDVETIVFIGAMLADVPHTRAISIFTSSENPAVRARLNIEQSSYEGPIGVMSVIAEMAESSGIETLSIWASVPHYVHNSPSPKAALALIQKIENLSGFSLPRGTLAEEAIEWENGINALANDDEEMAGYIKELEANRDAVDSVHASGEAIAQEFELYLKKRDDPNTENRATD